MHPSHPESPRPVRRERLLSAVLALSVGLVPAACSTAPEDGAIEAAIGAGSPGRAAATTVTLITGDRVHVTTLVGRPPALRIEPGAGRDHIDFIQREDRNAGHDDISIIPGDAAALLAAGRLDPRLFNVSALIRDGFDNARMQVLPLIVTYGSGRRAAAIAPRGATLARSLPSIDGAAIVEDKQDAGAFWTSLTAGQRAPQTLAASTGIAKVWLDGRARLLLDRSAPQIGAPEAHRLGFTGQGVTVAVLDTGIRLDHPDFEGRIAEVVDFTGEAPSGADDNGHGTHVAGTVLGSGAASGGAYKGVAPDATLIVGKVCNGAGSCTESGIIAAMEWAASRARIVNMSLGGTATDGTDPLALSVDRLTAQHGALFVIAAGNEGDSQQPGKVGSPATADSALAVASVTKEDVMSSFSSAGPRRGDGAVKPDVAAPGSDIVAARAKGFAGGDADPIDDHYARLSGTSMATPHVAGAAALLAQQHPDWRAAELKAALMSTATPIDDATIYNQGAGRVDLVRATSQQVFATVPSVSLRSLWPHTEARLTRAVTYRNDGARALTLDLAITANDPSGRPTPDGMFAVNARRITIPARGTSTVTVSWKPGPGAVGAYDGLLSATSGTVRVVVPVGGNKEPESYNLELRGIDRDGGVPEAVLLSAVDRATEKVHELSFATGSKVERLPKGTYDLVAVVHSRSSDPSAPGPATLMVQSGIVVDKDTSATLDARPGKLVAVSAIDRPTAVSRQTRVTLLSGDAIIGTIVGLGGQVFVVPAPATNPRLAMQVRVLLAEPPGSASDTYRYNLLLGAEGSIPDPDFRVRDQDLARVESHYYTQGVPMKGTRWDFPFMDTAEVSWLMDESLPGRRTEYFSAHDGVAWQHLLYPVPIEPGASPPADVESLSGLVEGFTPGERTLDWNRAPVGPALDGYSVVRDGDSISVTVALFSPSEDEHVVTTTPLPDQVEGAVTLSREGIVVGSTDLSGGTFEVPPEAATYTLSATATRSVPWSVIGTSADVTWGFRSEHVEASDELPPPLPLLVVRASGAVDDDGASAGGQPYPLTLRVQRQDEVPASALTELTLEVSYDDGATWQPAAVQRTEQGGTATVLHPAGDGFASLRIAARDADGNTVQQTVLRAYQIRGQEPGPGADAGTGNDARPDPRRRDGGGCDAGGGMPASAPLLVLLVIGVSVRRSRRQPQR
jgi:uncharacterized protein (TIGR03382 family)